MRLYVVRSDLAFASLQAVPGSHWHLRGGVAVGEAIRTPPLRPAENGSSGFIPIDCMTLLDGTDGIVISDFARHSIGALLDDAGEFVAVQVESYQYWWFNCLSCIDALDRSRTDADWERVEGDWGSFEWISAARRLEFRARELVGAPVMFRLPEYPQGMLLCSDALIEAVDRHGLIGFQFDLVWSTSQGGVTSPAALGLMAGLEEVAPDDLAERQRRAICQLHQRGQSPHDGK